MDATDSQPTPPPWRFADDTLSGPPRAHPQAPQSRVYSPATIVAHLPANFGGAYRYYPPGQRDANGRMLAATWDMLVFVHEVASLPGEAPTDPAEVAARARDVLSRHGLDRIVIPNLPAPTPGTTGPAGRPEP
jgi:hypothetical protein